MFEETKITYNGNPNYTAIVNTETVCPYCGKELSLKPIRAFYNEQYNNRDVPCLFICPKCNHYVFGEGIFYDGDPRGFQIFDTIFYPLEQPISNFSENIQNLSERFVEIYNQSLYAESLKLSEICGMGFRKALEILIKDFAISEHADDKDKILNLPLSKCIEAYCKNEEIKTLAKASAWIGNDETHYEKKHEDFNIDDLKNFINLVVSNIEYHINYLKAKSLIESKK